MHDNAARSSCSHGGPHSLHPERPAGRARRRLADDDAARLAARSSRAARAPRKAAPRAIAAPAPSCWSVPTARREAMNSCIALLGQIDGQSVRTVEGLRRPDGAPHPVQAAMAEADATQCGFCTPGFVMSAYAFAAGGEKPDARDHPRRAGRQSLPLHRLPADRRGDDQDRRSADRACARCRRCAPVRPPSTAPSSRRARSPSCWRCAPRIPRRCCWPAPPISACWPAGRASRRRPSSTSRTCRSSRRSREDKEEITIGAAVTYAEAMPLLIAAYPALKHLSRAAGLAADPHPGHDRRQYRHGLADRRHAAGAAGARGAAEARLGARRRASCRWRSSSSTIARPRWRPTR